MEAKRFDLVSYSESVATRRILMVDDQPGNVEILQRLLARAGYEEVRATTDSREFMGLFHEFRPDLVLLDLRMPHLDGFDLLDLLGQEIPEDEYLPILVLTGDSAPEVTERALRSGAKEFVAKPFNLTEVLLRIRNLLETRALHLKLHAYSETLEDRVRERTRELADAQVEILNRLALAAEYRDDITGRHAERVGLLSALLAQRLGQPEEEVRLLRRAATLHDVGKIGVPDAILMKPGTLSPQEFELMKSHTEIGARILSGSRFPLLKMAREIALTHHEKWDGTGYLPGRSGTDIPLVGRIVAVADVFDSLSHERPYKRASTMQDTVDYIRDASGTHFDPDVVEAFLQLVDQGELEGLDERVAANSGGAAIAESPADFWGDVELDIPLDPIDIQMEKSGLAPDDPRDRRAD